MRARNTAKAPIKRRQPLSFTSAENAAKRARRRAEPGLPGYRAPEISALTAPAPPVPGDAAQYVEAQRNVWLAEVETNARMLLGKDRAELFLKLLKLTSLHRVRVDVSAQLERLRPEPSLAALSNEELDRVLRGETIEIDALPDK